ncbi:MAG: GxxExxY protein [Planctomycetes bacterium]|nr:GxxExxY protein [Planctomycetota bacterium]
MCPTEHDLEKPFSEEGYALMGGAFEVHREIGGGLLEEIYQESLEIELAERGIPFRAKNEIAVFYKGRKLKKRYIPDLVVHEQVVVELKSVKELDPAHEAQLINYMRLSRQPVGYLINFGPIGKLQWKRFILSEFVTK